MIEYLIIGYVVCLVLILVYRFACVQNEINTPVVLRVEELRSDSMTDTITYQVSAGVPVSGDVVSRVLTVMVDGEQQSSTAYVGPVTSFGTISVPQDANVTVTLVDVDDAGNKSEPAEYSFVAVDTIPPAQPGALGVTLVGETHAEQSDVSPEIVVTVEEDAADSDESADG